MADKTVEQAKIAQALAEAVDSGANEYHQTDEEVVALAKDYLRVRHLAEVEYELLRDERGCSVYDTLSPRIDKLYMSLNARARGDCRRGLTMLDGTIPPLTLEQRRDWAKIRERANPKCANCGHERSLHHWVQGNPHYCHVLGATPRSDCRCTRFVEAGEIEPDA